MKNLKVYFMGQKLCEVYPHATKFQVLKWKVREFFKKVLRALTMAGLSLGVLYGVFMAGAYLNPITTYATKEKLVEVPKKSPVLERIAHCESNNMHFGKDGQVVYNANKNGSVDVGRYQINSVWNKKATELGLDITKEKDNEAMAQFIYENMGTEPWYSSKKCWSK